MPDLMEEIKQNRIKSDNYHMTIGGLSWAYHDGELILDKTKEPWSNSSKELFVESILLGYPISDIVVMQKEDGKWYVVDGNKRLATMLQLQRCLYGLDKEIYGKEELVLKDLWTLSSLNGLCWDTLPSEARRMINRTVINVHIILDKD